jgi:hypothetical protein
MDSAWRFSEATSMFDICKNIAASVGSCAIPDNYKVSLDRSNTSNAFASQSNSSQEILKLEGSTTWVHTTVYPIWDCVSLPTKPQCGAVKFFKIYEFTKGTDHQCNYATVNFFEIWPIRWPRTSARLERSFGHTVMQCTALVLKYWKQWVL